MTPQMKKMLLVTGIILGIVFGIYGVKKLLFSYFISHYEPPAVTISESIATDKTWQSYLTTVGTLTAVNGTDVSSEASGIVSEIRFESGQAVQKGDVLVLLDTSVEQAQLKNDQAASKLAQMNYDRYKTLLKKNVLAQSDFDTAFAKLEEAQANMQATQAKIQQKTVTAPFSGKIGIRLINIGQYLSAGTAMVTLQSLDPLYVQFNLPEQYLSELYLQQPVELTINNNGTNKKPINGTITAVNSKVDQATRNVLVQATIPNQDTRLYPGMFAQVKILLRTSKNVITLPQTAISYSLHGDSVFIIEPDKKETEKDGSPILHVKREYVKVGERRGGEVAILDGIKKGDRVVTSGQLKLQNGTHVVIDNSVEL
jgi:membrane fusion protein (multidrug efflux system)